MLLSLLTLPIALAGTTESSDADFARDVRPILAARCFSCHGPDANTRRGGLRLDTEEGLLAGGESGDPAVTREHPMGSSMLMRISDGADPSKQMPPADAEPLTEEEQRVLQGWILDGARWEDHWSFVQPDRPSPPIAEGREGTALDAFVEARLSDEGLTLSPRASKETLLRRVTLDLTGLPPTVEEIESFLADPEPGAYERVVDRLLASPSYGERMALQWLDVARYADTNGYSIDGGRHMWAWRDWVIDAFNENKPFDRFTVEQLAGDLLPDADVSTRIASGFNRNHMNTHEGGTIEEEYLVEYAADRVATTAQTWLGLTVGCARCHDHKYDPISQREYYQLFAYFNSITDRGNDGNGGVNSVPFIPVFSKDQEQDLTRLEGQRAALTDELMEETPERAERREAWIKEARGRKWPTPWLQPWRVAGPFRAASGDEAFTADFGPESGGEVEWVVRKDLEDGKPHKLLDQNAATYLKRKVTVAQETPLTLYLGSDDSIRVWWNGALVLDSNVKRGVAPDQEELLVAAQKGENELLVKIVNYGGPGGVFFRLGETGPPTEVLGALATPAIARSAAQQDILAGYHRSIDPELETLRTELAKLDGLVEEIEKNPLTTTMIMEERAEPRPAHVLMRGVYDQKGEQVQPGTPAILPPLPADSPPNRLGLARWLVSPENPLTARVAVNAYWQMFFGTGLVDTPEDFGTRGSLPSHPELLDWLAVEFVESGWDVKNLVRLIVTSRTYQQDSSTNASLLDLDPNNRLLARGSRFRLQAELIRDVALAASGLLSPRIGGASGRPYQPQGLWREMSHFGSTPATEQVYRQDHGEGLYRRGMYTIWKRTVPPPTLVAFDAPNREVCVVRRARTNTPLQALVLLNETSFVEAARALAQRVLTESEDTDADRIRYLYMLTVGRVPTAQESEVVGGALQRERIRYAADLPSARALLAVGESPRDDEIGEAEHAAWTVVASMILNLSETVTRG